MRTVIIWKRTTGSQIPNLDRLIKTPRHDGRMVLINTKHKIIVPPQFDYTITGHRIPQSHRLIIGRRRHEW